MAFGFLKRKKKEDDLMLDESLKDFGGPGLPKEDFASDELPPLPDTGIQTQKQQTFEKPQEPEFSIDSSMNVRRIEPVGEQPRTAAQEQNLSLIETKIEALKAKLEVIDHKIDLVISKIDRMY